MTRATQGGARDEVEEEIPPVPRQQVPQLPDDDVPEIPDEQLPAIADDVPEPPAPERTPPDPEP